MNTHVSFRAPSAARRLVRNHRSRYALSVASRTLTYEGLEDRQLLHADAPTLPITAGLVMRLNADEGVSTTGATVTSWADLSGQGNNLATLRGNPELQHDAINGHHGVFLDGVDDILGSNTLNALPLGATNRTVFVLARHDALGQAGFAYGNWPYNQAFGLELNQAGRATVNASGGGLQFSTESAGIGFGYFTHSAVVQNNLISQFVNGEEITTTTHTLDTDGTLIRLGSSIEESSLQRMTVSEVLVFNRALNNSERALMEEYFFDNYLPHRSDWTLQEVATANTPTALEFLPDGRLLILEKGGRIGIANTNSVPTTPSTYLEIQNVANYDELGLLDIALDPDFANNGHFFVYYSHAPTQKFRLSRFTHLGNNSATNTEVVIWESTTLTSCCHYGGGLTFGADGKLYLTLGDKFEGLAAGDLTSIDGKVIRLNKDGSIPADNPFVDGPGGNRDEIYAYGVRNPFRAIYDPVRGNVLVSEVGGNVQNTAWEDMIRVESGANYGWPNCEGLCSQPEYTDPFFTYPHQGTGASVIAGFVHDGTGVPGLRGTLFYGDYARWWIRIVGLDENGQATSDAGFSADAGAIAAMAQGPDGSIYFANLWGPISRYVYSGDTPPPTINQASASPTSGGGPLTVNFFGSASGTSGTMQYRWEFGDGEQAFEPNPTHIYTSSGNYQARLFATDNNGTTASNAISINVGSPPTVQITSPAPGSLFRAGETISYSATGNDPDGPLNSNSYIWTLEFLHNEHTHPGFQNVTGTSGTFQIPIDGHDFSDTTGYRLTVTVTDADGLSDTDAVQIYPDKVDVTFTTSPVGIPIQIDQLPVATPNIHDSMIGFQHQIVAPPTYCIGGVRHSFTTWSTGPSAAQTFVVPAQDTTVVASYTITGICNPGEPGDGIYGQPGADLAGRSGNAWWVGVSTGTEAVNEPWGNWSAPGQWVDVQVADVDGNGLDDIVGRNDRTWWVARSQGNGFVNETWGNWTNTITWKYVQTGDFNGDGRDDIAGYANGEWWIARSTGSAFVSEKWATWSNKVTWQDVRVGDFNGDGKDDIAGRVNGEWWVARSLGGSFVSERWGTWSKQSTWLDVQVADVDGNGQDDLVGRAGNTWWVARSNASQFTTEAWGEWSAAVTWLDVRVGDFNGDGRDDIAGRANGNWWVARSTGNNFVSENWGAWSTTVVWKDVRVADVNGDNRDDIVGRTSGRWWAGLSTGIGLINRLWTRWSDQATWQNVLVGNFSASGRSAPISSVDFNADGQINQLDIDQISRVAREGSNLPRYDLNSNGMVGPDDVALLVTNILNTAPGDSNLDGVFNSTDLVQIFQAGRYELATPDSAGWAEGDWDGDGRFTTSDLVHAMRYGAYTPTTDTLPWEETDETAADLQPSADEIAAALTDHAFADDDELHEMHEAH